MKKKTSLSLDRKVLKKIKAEAERQNRSVSGLVTLWLEKKFARNGKANANQKNS